MVEGLRDRKVEPKTFKWSLEETNEIETNLKAAVDAQKELGLGDPTAVYNEMLGGLKLAKPIKELAKLVEDGVFSFVHSPNKEDFPRFAGGENATSSVKFESKPGLVMVALSSKTKSVTCNAGRDEYKANIPVIPATASELAKRVKEKAPDATFHLIFEPSWEKQPQRDPVLLAQLNSSDNPDKEFWVNVASWDSDSTMIESLLKTRTVNV